MEVIIWIIAAIAFSVFRNRRKGDTPRFPRLPDVRNQIPKRPTGQMERPHRPTAVPVPPADRKPARVSMSEGKAEYTGPVSTTLHEPHESVRSTLEEPHETVQQTVHVSTRVLEAPEYRNEKRSQPIAESERAFAGQSAYDRIGTHPVGKPVRRSSPVSFGKNDLVRAVVMAEILGTPRARKSNPLPGRWNKK